MSRMLTRGFVFVVFAPPGRYVDKTKHMQVLSCLLCCVVSCFGCAQRCAEVFNFYAYVVVGIYGYGFVHAGGHVVAIFASKGLLLAEEGSLVAAVLNLGSAMVALSTAAAGALMAYRNPSLVAGVPYPITSAFVTCTVIGHGIASTMFSVVEAANATVFISYVENPHALHNDHPAEYAKLHHAWLAMGREEVKHDVAERLEEKTRGRARIGRAAPRSAERYA